ncbi:hypothetical protein QFZ72_003296 [Bacillus sp. V2I10]|nr:hypothetical protein [Bacillus sp. V2I10]
MEKYPKRKIYELEPEELEEIADALVDIETAPVMLCILIFSFQIIPLLVLIKVHIR